MRKLTTWLTSAALVFWTSAVSAAEYAEASEAGVVEALDWQSTSLIIGGLRYYVPIDARIEIQGGFGAYTMLQNGMNVVFTYRIIGTHRREIRDLRTVSKLSSLDES